MRRGVLISILVLTATVHASSQISTSALLDTLQHSAFQFFWNEANPANGLIKDRSTPSSPSSIASVGFGLSAICIGVDHGWVARPAAQDRVLRTLRTFWNGPQGGGTGKIGNYGLFYHFLDMTTAVRVWDSELSTIDTGLLLAGIIDAKQYFTTGDSIDAAIRALADSIYFRMNWELMRNYNAGILMGWTPATGFSGFGQWRGYNEASIMYIMAMGSPTYPVGADGWEYWTMGYKWQTHYGQTYVNFPPLFGHQYSHCWIDFRGIADEYMRSHSITYFENSRRATLAQRAYAIANPGGFPGYSDSLWGITASDVPSGYSARGAPPAENDDGTITPTAPASSLPFAPEVVLPVLHNMWNTYRPQLWMQYGFRDAFNLKVNWWDTDVIGIDQGPIIIMIENYRTGAVWRRFMQNPDIQRGLQVAGFQTVTAVSNPGTGHPVECELHQNYPNPFNGTTRIRFELPDAGSVHLALYDMLGREVITVLNDTMTAGSHEVALDASHCASGVYMYRLTARDRVLSRTLILLK
jgi:hypothetical protein